MDKNYFLYFIDFLRKERLKWESELLRVKPFVDQQRRKFLLPTFNTWAYGTAALAACWHRPLWVLPNGLGWGPWYRADTVACDLLLPRASRRWVSLQQRWPTTIPFQAPPQPERPPARVAPPPGRNIFPMTEPAPSKPAPPPPPPPPPSNLDQLVARELALLSARAAPPPFKAPP